MTPISENEGYSIKYQFNTQSHKSQKTQILPHHRHPILHPKPTPRNPNPKPIPKQPQMKPIHQSPGCYEIKYQVYLKWRDLPLPYPSKEGNSIHLKLSTRLIFQPIDRLRHILKKQL